MALNWVKIVCLSRMPWFAGRRIGRKNIFDSFCSVGGDPQDLKFSGEATKLEIGNENRFREFSTVSRGTTQGGGVTGSAATICSWRILMSLTIASSAATRFREWRDACRACDH